MSSEGGLAKERATCDSSMVPKAERKLFWKICVGEFAIVVLLYCVVLTLKGGGAGSGLGRNDDIKETISILSP